MQCRQSCCASVTRTSPARAGRSDRLRDRGSARRGRLSWATAGQDPDPARRRTAGAGDFAPRADSDGRPGANPALGERAVLGTGVAAAAEAEGAVDRAVVGARGWPRRGRDGCGELPVRGRPSGSGSTLMCSMPSGATMSSRASQDRSVHCCDGPRARTRASWQVNARPVRSPEDSRPVRRASVPAAVVRTGTKSLCSIKSLLEADIPDQQVAGRPPADQGAGCAVSDRDHRGPSD
jgi:hypothetical protein